MLVVILVVHGIDASVPLLSQEECARELDTLGVYYDASRKLFIITIAKDDRGSHPLCPRNVAVERLNVTRATLKAVQDALAQRTFHSDATRYTYASWLDLKTAKIIVITDAPRDVLKPLRREFGDVLVFRSARLALDSNDVRDQRHGVGEHK